MNNAISIEIETLKKILDIALGNGGDFAEIYVENSFSLSVNSKNLKLKNSGHGRDSGVALLLTKGTSTYFSYTNTFKKQALFNIACKLAKSKNISLQGRYNFINSNKNRVDHVRN